MDSYRKKFIALDLETTHLDVKEGRIMEIGAVEATMVFDEQKKQVKVEFGKSLTRLVNPEIEPSAIALMLTGITTEELREAPLWKELKPRFQEFLQDQVIVGHNVWFDLEFLKNQGLNLKNPSWDTLEIAQTILPLAAAHSLEYLVTEFEVSKEPSHRALADAQNCALVLAAVLNEFLRLPEELQTEVRDWLEKSKLAFRELILDLPTTHNPLQLPLILRGRENGKIVPPLRVRGGKGELLNILDFPDKTIVSLPLGFKGQQQLLNHLAKEKGFLAAVSHPVLLDFVEASQKITDPSVALCETRLNWLKQAEKLPDVMIRMLIKLQIQEALEPSFDLFAIKWSPEERPFLPFFKVEAELCSKHGCGYFQALGVLGRKEMVFLELSSLFTLAQGTWPLKFLKERQLLLFDLSRIEEELVESMTRTWNLRSIRESLRLVFALELRDPSWFRSVPKEVDTIAAELDLFFGILHLVYLKREGDFAQNILLGEDEISSERFGKLLAPAEKLHDKLQNFATYLQAQITLQGASDLQMELQVLEEKIKNLRAFLEEFFFERKPEKIYWFKFNDKWVDLKSAFRNLRNSTQEIFKKFQSVTLIDTKLPKLARDYYENRLGLESFKSESFAPPSLQLKVKVKFFSQALNEEELQSFLLSLSGNSLLVLPNESKLEELYGKLKGAQKNGLPEILAYKFSGNLSLLQNKIQSARNFLLLLTTNALLRFFPVLPPLRNLIIFRLPFEAPGKRAPFDTADDDNFLEHVLPRTLSLLHTLVSRFLSSGGKAQEIYLLDQRILSEYDQTFLKYFEEFPEFEISTIDKA